MIIGITGGTGCGKTTLLRVIEAAGGLVLDCDRIYHELLKNDPSLLAAIEEAFPGTVVGGQLDRKKLGSLVFSDAEALQTLNRITHGAVKKEVLRRLQAAPSLVAIDAIGLFEGGLAELCQVTVAVAAPRDARIQRLMARDGIEESYAAKRIDAQHDGDWFREKCGYCLENDGTEAQFREKSLAFLKQLGIMKEN